MNTKQTLKCLALFALGLLAGPLPTSAFYNPIQGRWLNRDPIGEPGFETSRLNAGNRADNLNPYVFVGNNAIGRTDPEGLRIWVCTIPTSGFPLYGAGTHAYFWDDRNGTDPAKRGCGMEGSSGSGSSGNSSGNYGPVDNGTNSIPEPWTGNGMKGLAECYPVDDSDGKEDALMTCCRNKANNGPFIPYAHDCHDALDRCLKENKLSSPPHSRGDAFSNHVKDIECACRELDRLGRDR